MTKPLLSLRIYQNDAARTAPGPYDAMSLAVFALGVAGESGEVAELIKKHVGHGHVLDKAKVTKELGDVLWYIAALCTALDLELEDVAEANIAKLRARYPEGFDPERSQNRKPGDV